MKGAEQEKVDTIILWASPRTTSTMFERAFLTRCDEFRVLHEPLADPWYFGPEHVSSRFSSMKYHEKHSQHKDLSFNAVWTDIAGNGPNLGSLKTFCKEMAKFLFVPTNHAGTAPALPEREKGNPTLIPEALLLSPHIKHTFLIRTPVKTVPSFYDLCHGEKSKVTGFEYFVKEDIGIRELRALYEYILLKTGTESMIIDSDDLIDAPEVMMKNYCAHIGIEFKPSMLNWDSGRQPNLEKWTGWHDYAMNSTGIHKPGSSTCDSRKEWPAEVKEAIEVNMDDYEWLHARRFFEYGSHERS